MSAKDGKVDVNQLNVDFNLEQLTEAKKQLDQELGMFQDSLNTLKIAQGKYNESKESVEKVKEYSKGGPILVPLTGSIFVPGSIADSEKVLVDVGTGYFLDMGVDNAVDYFKRRVTYVTEQMEKIQNIGREKSRMREVIINVMESKIQAQLAAQRPAAAKT